MHLAGGEGFQIPLSFRPEELENGAAMSSLFRWKVLLFSFTAQIGER
jgi:hypothetical protein